MKHNQNYEDFVLKQCRQQRTPRTLLEAYRDGEYGYTIHLFKDDVDRTREFFVEFFIWLTVFGLALVLFLGFATWLGVV
jgi:hypothetical protein